METTKLQTGFNNQLKDINCRLAGLQIEWSNLISMNDSISNNLFDIKTNDKLIRLNKSMALVSSQALNLIQAKELAESQLEYYKSINP